MADKERIYTLQEILAAAEAGGYAVGAFSPRYTAMITPILKAGEKLQSPLLVQIAQPELNWYHITVEWFAEQFRAQMESVRPSVPVGLHLDHTRDFDVIAAAIACGFTSVMIDASALEFSANIAATREVVAYAHARGVSVEAELGRIGAADSIESDSDEELFTDPQEAQTFVEQTGVDALAVSVGTAHGVYRVRQPRIDIERLAAIRALTPVLLVLHGGSGTPAEMIQNAIRLPGGGVSKVNIATDLELALLAELGLDARISDSALRAMPADALACSSAAVQTVVEDKIRNFLCSAGQAPAALAFISGRQSLWRRSPE